MKNMKPPALNERSSIAANRSGKSTIWWPLYDFVPYPAAGQTQLTLFQQPIGGVSGGTTKTQRDTNMTAAGQLPAKQSFIITGVEVLFIPGEDPTFFGTGAVNDFTRDVWTVFRDGYARLFIGSTDYMQVAPIGRMPPQFRLGGYAAASDASTAAVDQNLQIAYASVTGPEYQISRQDIPSNQNFSFSLHWDAALALPSGNDGRIGVFLNGWLTRNSQ